MIGRIGPKIMSRIIIRIIARMSISQFVLFVSGIKVGGVMGLIMSIGLDTTEITVIFSPSKNEREIISKSKKTVCFALYAPSP